jgi:PAS domain S-box-containing protein
VQAAPKTEVLKVLLVEDDEDDYILTRGLFAEIKGQRFQLVWVKSFQAGLQEMIRNQQEVCLVDYRLGAQNGIDLLREALRQGCQSPIILLTGQGEHEIDLEAMKAGAADYLVKVRLDAGLLERSIRYALERKRGAGLAVAEQARLAAFGADVGLALTRRDSLETILQRCASAMVSYLGASLARLWVFDPEDNALKLQASAGPAKEIEGAPKTPKVRLDLEVIGEGNPVLINPVIGDPRVLDQEWARREGIISFAAYPLVLEERLVGLMALFARNSLSKSILQEMASVANGIALCIDRKRSAEALGASEFKYQSVVENIKEVIFQVNEAGRWTFLNPAWTEITGFKVKDTLGTPFADYVHPDDRERNAELFRQLIEHKKSCCRDETRYLAADGTFRWVEVYAQPTFDPNVIGTSGTIRDITERKRAEAEIQKLAAFVRLNPDPVMELAADGTLTYLNPAAREMARSLGLDDPEAILPKEAAAVARECLRLGHSKLRQEISINGRTLSWSFFPIIASQVVHCYGSDMTDRMNLEAQLRHAQKMESVGQLAAGVAHDFNNILTIIQGHTDRLLARGDNHHDITEPLKQVSAAARRASSLTRQLLMFSRKQVMQPRVLDLNLVLSNLAKMLHRLLGEDIALEFKYASGIPMIAADTGMLEQVIVNLAVNARDAMPKGGQLLITTSAATFDLAYVQQHPEAHAGQCVSLSVTDTGSGMDKLTLARIFEPFFTTKEVGKGTGLGLATVYGIVKQHQGWVEVNSEFGLGTTFRIFIPGTSEPAETVVEKPPAPKNIRGGRETILLVEDEPVLRELARVILQDYEYQVLEAGSGVEALKVWEAHEGRIDLLLTDMVMPEGMTGCELAQNLRARKPGLKVIYTSGYSPEVMGRDSGPHNTTFLQKPYPPPQLAQTVRECLDF